MKRITLALCALFSQLIFAQDGAADTTFGTNGYVLLNTDNGVTLDRRVQPDGTTIYIHNGKFHRLTANGLPDATFGVDGAINIVQSYTNYQSFTVENNQITLISKGTYDNYAMGRYNFDGTVDATLGTGGQGWVFLNVGTDIKGNIYSEKSPDGKIFIGGNSSTAYGSYNNYYIRRYNTDGTHDSSYNFNSHSLGINISQTSIGYYTEEFSSGIKVRPDGNAVIYGYSAYYESSSSFVSNRKTTAAIVAPTGQPIRLQHSYESFYGWKYDLAFDQDNNTYMLGGQTNFGSNAVPYASIKKFTPTGGNANSFGTAGTLVVSLDIDATTKADFRKILVQPDGKILLAGMAVTTTAGQANQFPYLVMARFLSNGTLDTTFGNNGYILHDIDHPNTAANRNNITQFYASADFSSIFIGGNNLQNAIILKYSNQSMAPLAVPVFDAIAPICAGDTAPALAAASNNGISGTWSPAVIDNTTSGTYTFTPDQGQHATTANLNVTVNQPTTSTVTESACETFTWA
ncbi:delta-60 repeat domain-containing protein, partial [Flavobacterium caeni]